MEQVTHRQKRHSPPDACYRDYHGAPIVELVFRIAEWWLQTRNGQVRTERMLQSQPNLPGRLDDLKFIWRQRG